MNELKKKMLNYCYQILSKMSFDRELFQKELKKCIGYLNQQDAEILRGWVNEKFKDLVAA